jgi:hypothetical protein
VTAEEETNTKYRNRSRSRYKYRSRNRYKYRSRNRSKYRSRNRSKYKYRSRSRSKYKYRSRSRSKYKYKYSDDKECYAQEDSSNRRDRVLKCAIKLDEEARRRIDRRVPHFLVQSFQRQKIRGIGIIALEGTSTSRVYHTVPHNCAYSNCEAHGL